MMVCKCCEEHSTFFAFGLHFGLILCYGFSCHFIQNTFFLDCLGLRFVYIPCHLASVRL
jgi:hypothetical protein